MGVHEKGISVNIFFDLDGTLLDSRKRLYILFCDLVHVCNLTFEQYWDYKRNKVSNEAILKQYFQFNEDQIKEFNQQWMLKIELEEYLDLDTTYEGVIDLLHELAASHFLYVVSHRQFEDTAVTQLRKLQLLPYFQRVLITNQRVKKESIIRSWVHSIHESDVLVGDTGHDVQTARELGIISVAVSNGFLNKKVLETYQPDFLFDSVADIDFKKLGL